MSAAFTTTMRPFALGWAVSLPFASNRHWSRSNSCRKCLASFGMTFAPSAYGNFVTSCTMSFSTITSMCLQYCTGRATSRPGNRGVDRKLSAMAFQYPIFQDLAIIRSNLGACMLPHLTAAYLNASKRHIRSIALHLPFASARRNVGMGGHCCRRKVDVDHWDAKSKSWPSESGNRLILAGEPPVGFHLAVCVSRIQAGDREREMLE